jgi:hypothetical protein
VFFLTKIGFVPIAREDSETFPFKGSCRFVAALLSLPQSDTSSPLDGVLEINSRGTGEDARKPGILITQLDRARLFGNQVDGGAVLWRGRFGALNRYGATAAL